MRKAIRAGNVAIRARLQQGEGFHEAGRPIPGASADTVVREPVDVVEDAVWSAQGDTGTGYGIAVFDVDAGERWQNDNHDELLSRAPCGPRPEIAGRLAPDYCRLG